RDGPALAVAPGEPAALQGAPHDRPEAMRLAHGKDLALRLAREDGVRRLRRDEALEVAALADPEGFHHPPAAEVHAPRLVERPRRDTQVAHLALAHEIAERPERLLERRVPVVAMYLVEVDPVRAQPAQALLHLEHDVAARGAAVEHAARAGHEDL